MSDLWTLPTFLLTLAATMGATTMGATTMGEPPAAVGEQAIAPNLTDPATEILQIEEEANDRMTVPVMIDNKGPFNFMIDTGSQATAVTDQINETLALPSLGTATVIGMASRRDVNMVGVDTLTMGDLEVYDLESPVLNRVNVGADGIIGLDTLQDFRVLIDFRDDTIAVEDTLAAKNRKGFEIVVRAREKQGQLLVTDAYVEGVRTVVIVDTGAQASLANEALRERIRTKRAQEVTTTDVNGVSMTGKLSFVRSLSFGGLTLTDVPLAFADAPAFEALGLKDRPALSLGMQHLRLFDRVAIDFTSKRILFDVPRDVARAMRKAKQQRSFGF